MAATAAQTAAPKPTPRPNAGSWKRAGSLDIDELSGPAVVVRDGKVLAIGSEADTGAPVAALWNPTKRRWRSTTALPAPRTQAAVVPLQDGRALVAGGFNGRRASYSSAYVFDPGPETWSKVGLMDKARAAPAAAVLPDGRVLVAGGYNYVEPDWEAAAPTVVLARAVPGATPSTVTPDDVEVPPHGYALATAELFDPRTGSWTRTGPMRFARVGAAAVTLSDGRVLVVGSSAEEVERVDARAYENAEVYDPATGRFTLVGRLPAIRAGALEQSGKNPVPDEAPWPGAVGTLVALEDGGALLVGHAGWWKHVGEVSRSFQLMPDHRTWQETGDTWLIVGEPTRKTLFGPATRDLSSAAVTGLSRDRVLVAGGNKLITSRAGWSTDASTAATLFDGGRDRWWKAPAMPDPVRHASAVTLPDGSALVFGGWVEETEDGTEVMRDSFLYVPTGP